MPALIEEISRSVAEQTADEHDAEWHAPVFDDEPVLA